MTELEIMQRAKLYMDKLSQGIDPISDQALPYDTALNQERLRKCFAYVAGVLGKTIQNGGEFRSYDDREPFFATAEQLSVLRPFTEPVTISQLVDRINEAVAVPQRKKLSAGLVTNWLLDKGFLVKELRADGKYQRLPSESGRLLGLSARQVSSPNGDYQLVIYDPAAQQFVLDHLPAMLEERAQRKKNEA